MKKKNEETLDVQCQFLIVVALNPNFVTYWQHILILLVIEQQLNFPLEQKRAAQK